MKFRLLVRYIFSFCSCDKKFIKMKVNDCETHGLLFSSIVMSVNTCLIYQYRCLSSASAVIRSWFIYELQKSTTITFSRNSLYTFYSRNPTCGIHPCLRICNLKYPPPPCPQNSVIVNPPSPSEILKAVCGMVWIFSGITQ